MFIWGASGANNRPCLQFSFSICPRILSSYCHTVQIEASSKLLKWNVEPNCDFISPHILLLSYTNSSFTVSTSYSPHLSCMLQSVDGIAMERYWCWLYWGYQRLNVNILLLPIISLCLLTYISFISSFKNA